MFIIVFSCLMIVRYLIASLNLNLILARFKVGECQNLTMIGSHNDDNSCFFCLCGNTIPSVEVVRGWACWQQSSVWSPLLNLCKRLSRMINIIFRSFKICFIFTFCNSETLTRNFEFAVELCRCYVWTLSDYCCQLYFPFIVKNTKLSESFQKRLCGLRLSHQNYVERLKRFCSETLESRKIKFDLISIYKLACGRYNLDVSDFISFSSYIFITCGMV